MMLGERLKEERERLELSQEQLGAIGGVKKLDKELTMKKLLTHFCLWYLRKTQPKPDINTPTYIRRGLKIDEVK